MDEPERSKSGSPVYRYGQRTRDFEAAVGSEDSRKIESHIESYVGPIHTVFHELMSDRVHLDIHFVPPTKERHLHTLVTTGMSDLPMNAPAGAEQCRYAELVVVLPPTWQLGENEFRDESNYWVVRMLKMLARFPHEYDTWFWWGHSIPNGDPAEPLHSSTKFVGAILAPPVTIEEGFFTFKCTDEKEVHFFAVIPLYQEEIDFKLEKGADALFERFDEHGITEVVDINRPNVAKKRWKWF